MKTVPELRVLVGGDVWSVYGRALRSLWFRKQFVFVLYGLAAAALIAVGIRAGDVAPAVTGVTLLAVIPVSLAGMYLHRAARPAASITLVTDRAHLALALKKRRGRVKIVPTDHWVDRCKIRGEAVRGQATEFRREVLRLLIEHDATVTARAANPRVRNLYENVLRALHLDPAPFLKGKRRLNVTSEQLRAQIAS
ncbi:MAG: hypothetical protein K0S70_3938 [Microbacterium sp.]|jgi:hypothetical protein|nr:hypothetical protein [Microbacterium sp.]